MNVDMLGNDAENLFSRTEWYRKGFNDAELELGKFYAEQTHLTNDLAYDDGYEDGYRDAEKDALINEQIGYDNGPLTSHEQLLKTMHDHDE